MVLSNTVPQGSEGQNKYIYNESDYEVAHYSLKTPKAFFKRNMQKGMKIRNDLDWS